MKTIKERAREFVNPPCDRRCKSCDTVKMDCRFYNDLMSFIAGAESEHEELTRWHDPKEELPEDNREVLCIVNRQHCKFVILHHDKYGWWQYVPFMSGGWCGYNGEIGEIIGWREIHEDTKASNDSK